MPVSGSGSILAEPGEQVAPRKTIQCVLHVPGISVTPSISLPYYDTTRGTYQMPVSQMNLFSSYTSHPWVFCHSHTK